MLSKYTAVSKSVTMTIQIQHASYNNNDNLVDTNKYIHIHTPTTERNTMYSRYKIKTSNKLISRT